MAEQPCKSLFSRSSGLRWNADGLDASFFMPFQSKHAPHFNRSCCHSTSILAGIGQQATKKKKRTTLEAEHAWASSSIIVTATITLLYQAYLIATMETALQSLTNTLSTINSRQAAARKRARKGLDATPFTSAVLNREGFEITTYIRDADIQTEANLFWYPPLPQSASASASRAGPSSSNHRSAHLASSRTNGSDETNEADLLLAPRLPEPRHVAPPTPLRNTSSSNKQPFQSQDDQSVDPRVLLLAAQRLNDTCGKGSRTRKHIKGLLKTHAALNQDIKNYEQHIRQSEAQLRATAEGKPLASSSTDVETPLAHPSRSANDQLQSQLAAVQDRIQNEELEVLALEEMIEELRQARSEWQRQELERQQNAQAQAEATRMQARQQTPQRAFPRAFG